MKKYSVLIAVFAVVLAAVFITSCATTSEVSAAKSGAQLWGENCLRCHNTPSPATFSDSQWDAAVLHMRVRANLTDDEALKIAEFLKSAN